ncbi:MAG: hypothetical protein RLY13_26 [Actinomycetota bacterium]|jgi:hypothetical protein
MPKKRNNRPKKPVSQGSSTSSSQNRKLRAVAIWIILSLILSLLVGALSITPTPASAQETPAVAEIYDTDGDGIENDLDPDIDGDGTANGVDDDIDGDEIGNFDDADPIGTNGGEGIDEQKPLRPDTEATAIASIFNWVAVGGFSAISVAAAIIFWRRKTR